MTVQDNIPCIKHTMTLEISIGERNLIAQSLRMAFRELYEMEAHCRTRGETLGAQAFAARLELEQKAIREMLRKIEPLKKP